MDLPKKVDIINDIFSMIASGLIEQAIEKLHTIYSPTSSEYLLEAKLLISLDRKDEARILLYRCINKAFSSKITDEAVKLLEIL